MLLLSITVSAAILTVIYLRAPKKYSVHAARAVNFPPDRRLEGRISPFHMFAGEEHLLGWNKSEHFFGEAVGSSMLDYGIQDGADFVGKRLPNEMGPEDRCNALNPKDVVVIHDKAEHSPSGYRLRVVENIDPEKRTIEFYNDNNGKAHSTRSVDKVVAIVTHVLG